MTQYILKDNEASDMMWNAGLGGGGPYVHCSCGIDHTLPDDLTDEEYEAAESYFYIEVDGMLFVESCDGCREKLLKYENFIWNNRKLIRNYLKTRIEQEHTWAEQEKLLNTIAGI